MALLVTKGPDFLNVIGTGNVTDLQSCLLSFFPFFDICALILDTGVTIKLNKN